jgi:hypothetical protein
MAGVLGQVLAIGLLWQFQDHLLSVKSRGCLIYAFRKEIGHGKAARSDESGFGIKEP